jgi:hypothetical protein
MTLCSQTEQLYYPDCVLRQNSCIILIVFSDRTVVLSWLRSQTEQLYYPDCVLRQNSCIILIVFSDRTVVLSWLTKDMWQTVTLT